MTTTISQKDSLVPVGRRNLKAKIHKLKILTIKSGRTRAFYTSEHNDDFEIIKVLGGDQAMVIKNDRCYFEENLYRGRLRSFSVLSRNWKTWWRKVSRENFIKLNSRGWRHLSVVGQDCGDRVIEATSNSLQQIFYKLCLFAYNALLSLIVLFLWTTTSFDISRRIFRQVILNVWLWRTIFF